MNNLSITTSMENMLALLNLANQAMPGLRDLVDEGVLSVQTAFTASCAYDELVDLICERIGDDWIE